VSQSVYGSIWQDDHAVMGNKGSVRLGYRNSHTESHKNRIQGAFENDMVPKTTVRMSVGTYTNNVHLKHRMIGI